MTVVLKDPKKTKSAKTVRVHACSWQVDELSSVFGKPEQWTQMAEARLEPCQTEVTVAFEVPVVGNALLIEFVDFHTSLQALSSEILQCPRFSRVVTGKHGICRYCHENVYQCRQCRNINYENLDAFLCNECGFSRYVRYEVFLHAH